MEYLIAYLKPNFNFRHPLNFLFVLLLFVGSFSFASIAQAFEDDGTWSSGSYYQIASCWNSGYCGVSPTKSTLCSSQGLTYNGSYCTNWNNTIYNISQLSCGTGSNPVDAFCGIPPDPVEPQSCTDLADQNPDGATVTIEGYAAEMCSKGCKAITGSMSRAADSDSWTGTAYFTTEECNGGFDLAKADEQLKDTYQHDDQLQNCYDSTGRLTGQISASLTCPQLSVCYDSSTGEAVGTTSTSSSCETGVKYNELGSSVAPNSETTSSSVTVDPDGTSTEVKETVTTQTALDGSEEVVKETTTITRDANGAILDNSTTQEFTTRKAVSACDNNPNLPECQVKDDSKVTVKVSDNCVTPPACSGDPVGCNLLIMQWKQQCSVLTADGLESWKSSPDGQAYLGDVDASGQIMGLDAGTVDVAEQLNLSGLGDNGDAGSCPSPHLLGLGHTGNNLFEYTTICQAASVGRPIVIFAAMWLSFVMVRRKLLGA